MTPSEILLKCGIHPSKIAKFVVKIEPPLPESLHNKRMLRNVERGLTTSGETRKRTKHYHVKATGERVRSLEKKV